jgi:choline kinase
MHLKQGSLAEEQQLINKKMNAILLCAGVGKRLKEVTGDLIPKCLVEIGGKPIIQWQLEALFSAGVKNVTVVTGFKAEKIKEFLKDNKNISFIHNSEFATTNIIVSLHLALEQQKGNDLFIAAGDLIFKKDILDMFLTHGKSDIAVAIGRKELDAEAVKVYVKNNLVTRLGKDLVIADSYGEFLGLLWVHSSALVTVQSETKALVESAQEKQAYIFTMLNRLISDHHARISYVDIADSPWEEIDYKVDVQRACVRFKQ